MAHKVSLRLSRGYGLGDAEHGPLGPETHNFLEVLHPTTPLCQPFNTANHSWDAWGRP